MTPLFSVIADTNVLFSAKKRDLLFRLANEGVFTLHWSPDILGELRRVLLPHIEKRNPSLSAQDCERKVEHLIDQMTRNVRGEELQGYENFIPCLVMEDENDRHVLAAAIIGQCDAIITEDKGFTPELLAPYDLEAISTDDFLCSQIGLVPEKVRKVVKELLDELQGEPASEKEFLASLRRNELPKFADAVEEMIFAP